MKLLLYLFLVIIAWIVYIIFILYTIMVIILSYIGIETPLLELHYHYIWLSYIIYSLYHITSILEGFEELRLDKYLIPNRDKHKFYSNTGWLRKSLLAKILKQFYIFIINVVFIIRRRFKQY